MNESMSDRTKLMLFWPVAGFFVIAAFGMGLISMAAFDSDQESIEPVSSTGAASGGEAQVVEVTLGDLFIKPGKISAPAGDVEFKVTNDGAGEHNFAIEGEGATDMIPPGGSATLSVSGLEPGNYTVICQVSGHAQGGMTGDLVVTEGETTEANAHEGHTTGMSGMSAEEMAKVDAEVTGSFPAETKVWVDSHLSRRSRTA